MCIVRLKTICPRTCCSCWLEELLFCLRLYRILDQSCQFRKPGACQNACQKCASDTRLALRLLSLGFLSAYSANIKHFKQKLYKAPNRTHNPLVVGSNPTGPISQSTEDKTVITTSEQCEKSENRKCRGHIIQAAMRLIVIIIHPPAIISLL